MGVPSRTSAPTPVLIRTSTTSRSSSGRCATSRHQAEGHPQVLIIAPTAIRLFLYHNLSEREVATAMGVSVTNPVGMYATDGLAKMLGWAYRGELAGVSFPFAVDDVPPLPTRTPVLCFICGERYSAAQT